MNDEERSTEVFLFQKHLLSAFHLQQFQSQSKSSLSRVCSDQSNAEHAGGDTQQMYTQKMNECLENVFIFIKFLSSDPLMVLTWPRSLKLH